MSIDLRWMLQEAGATPDPGAGRAFRRAAAAMAMTGDADARRRWGREAVEALVSLATAGCDAELRSLLTPDPVNQNVTWTVACYQVGDLAPSAVRDFSDPADAIATLVACPDATHVAAELVASTQLGLRWTAMARTNTQREFRLPDADSASDASHSHGTELADALRRWRRQLADWAEKQGAGDDPPRAAMPSEPPREAFREPTREPTAAPTADHADEIWAAEWLPTLDTYNDTDNGIDYRVEMAIENGIDVSSPAARSSHPKLSHDVPAPVRLHRRLAQLERAIGAVAGVVQANIERADRLEHTLVSLDSKLEGWTERTSSLDAGLVLLEDGLASLSMIRSELHLFADRNETVRSTVQSRVDAITTALAHYQTVIDRRLADAESRLALGVAQGFDATGARLRHVAQAIEDATTRAEDRGQHLETSAIDAIADVARRTDDRLGRVQSALTQAEHSIDDRTARLEATVRAAQAVGKDVAQRVARLEASASDDAQAVRDALEDVLARLDSYVERLWDQLERDTATLAGNIGRVDASVSEATGVVTRLVEQRLADVASTMRESVEDRLSRSEASVAAATAGTARDLASAFDDATSALDNSLGRRVAQLEAALDERVGRVEGAVSQVATTLRAEVDERIGRIERVHGESAAGLAASLDERVTRVESAVSSSAAELAASLGERVAQLERSHGEGAAQLSANLDERVARIESAVSNASTELAATLDDRVGHIERTQRETAAELTANLDQRATRVEVAVASSAEALAANVDQRVADVERSQREIAAELAASVDQRVGDVERSHSDATTALVRTTGERVARLESLLAAGQQALQDAVDERVGRFESTAAAAAEEMGRSVDSGMAQLRGLMNSAVHGVGRTLDDEVVRLEEAIAALERTVASGVEPRLARLEEALERSATTLVERVQRELSSSAQERQELRDALADLRANLLG